MDYVPDPNFTWDLAEMMMQPKGKGKKKKSGAAASKNIMPLVIK